MPRRATNAAWSASISRPRPRAELVTDDVRALRERLEAATGERVSALERIGAETEKPAIQHKAGVHGRGGGAGIIG